jgi:hypothetical protein
MSTCHPPRLYFLIPMLIAAVGAEMNRIFMEDLQHAEAITLATFRQRSFVRRVMERGANLIMRVL